MRSLFRAGFLAALVAFACLPANAADKAFRRDDLAEGAIRLEAQIKRDAGQVGKAAAALRKDTEAAFGRNDFRNGLQLLGQLVAVAPEDGANWLWLARTVLQIRAANDRDRTLLLERAGTAAYIAYQRAENSRDEADALAIIGRTYAERKIWRPALDALRLALETREVADVRAQYERLREDHGFRLLDYTVEADSAAPRACFQFSEDLPGKRTDFSPFVAITGMDKPAITVDERQLCVEGLKHGERYNVTLRAGLPSTVKETLAKAAEFNVYVRDRKPFVRFSAKAYVLPRTGQRGIPIVSVNTKSVALEIYRVGDRNLLDTVIDGNFQRNLRPYEIERLKEERASKVWQGEVSTESPLNADVVTAVPIDQAVPALASGVYVMTAEPAGKTVRDYSGIATQWFIVSDLGLTALSGNDGIHVFAHALGTAEPRGKLDVRLLARNNEQLAVKSTDSAGHAHFEVGLTRGEGGLSPALLIASEAKGGDYAFLNLKGPGFDLSDRGVAGRTVPDGLDAFVYTERGVYRSGETVHITALLRDANGTASANAPLTLIVQRSDGIEYRRAVLPDQGVGGRSWSVPITASASTGTWRVQAFADPKRPPIGEASFLVEDYVPDRLEFTLSSSATAIARGKSAEIALDGRYLYGAPAANLDIEGDLVIAQAKERPGFAGYRFGLADEEITPERLPLEDLPQTDAAGKARITVGVSKIPVATRPLEARLTVRLAEAGGRAVERKLTLPVTPETDMIGVKPLFSGRSLGEKDNATFDVAVVQPDGKQTARQGLRYELLKIETRYQWYRREGRWDYEPIKLTRRVADGTVDTAANAPGRISLPVTWGRYRLEVSSTQAGGLATSVGFDAGFYAEASADTPDLLEIAVDKSEYKPGDAMTVAVTARSAGRVTVNVIGDRLLATATVEVKPGVAQIPLKVGKDWGNGAYVVATLRRPLDAQAQRMPGRAIGVQWFSIDRAARTLALDMTLPQLVRPNSALNVPVKLTGLANGDEARVVIAAVDVGILNLTNYKPPAPDDFYFGQRRLTAEIRDLYGQLIDGMQGTRGQIKTGGDAGAEITGSPPTQAPLALYSGIVKVTADGTANVAFDIPAFAGTVRVMAVAWSKDKLGKAVGDVTVRDPVVLTATLPRFLLTGDRGAMHLELDNVEGEAGEYKIALKADGPLSAGEGTGSAIRLAAKQRTSITVPLSASAAGAATVGVSVTGPGGFALARSYPLSVKPATQILARRTVRTIAKGESLTLSGDLFADLVPGSGSVAISVGPSIALDAATLLKALDRYPFGCAEQITSRALPLLYVNDLASEAHLALDVAVDQRIRDAIERLLARQGPDGSFGLWSVGGDDAWLDAYVTDFLTRARERGFAVPDVAFKLAVDRLRNFTGIAPEPAKDGGRDLAYALYVLARNGAAPLGDLRYLADAKLSDLATPIAKAQIAAALGLLGDRARAERVYAAALAAITPQPGLEFGRADYGSQLRDAAALVTLAAEGNAPRPTITAAVQRIEAARAISDQTSTQENAWLVLAARAIGKDAGMALSVNGQGTKGPLYRNSRNIELQVNPLRVTNEGDAELKAVVTVSGAPLTPEPAAEKGFQIERLYYTLDGEPADVATVKQNQRLAVVLKITEPEPRFGRIIVADYLPAGFEIDNPRLVSSGETGTLAWIESAVTPVHSEFRDDRFTAAFERGPKDSPLFAVAYVVRAVSPGKYVHPQAYVEDMYRPERFGRTATGGIEITAAK
ncbi:MAG: alpha-2-macroglobulin family protein [Rhizobiales bacterium]|nr:alpha-2-macroglobulin family protein [Hyphomicrobiales bacterium]